MVGDLSSWADGSAFPPLEKGGWLENYGFYAQVYAILPSEHVCVVQALGTNGVLVLEKVHVFTLQMCIVVYNGNI